MSTTQAIRHAEALLAVSFEMLESELESWQSGRRVKNERHELRIKRSLDSIQYARRQLEENL